MEWLKKEEFSSSKMECVLRTKQGHVYEGTVLEHILVQTLVQFFNVGDHNIIRLEDADWNDGLDMARARGESVAFTALYAGNMLRRCCAAVVGPASLDRLATPQSFSTSRNT